jgi:hypothetical protein
MNEKCSLQSSNGRYGYQRRCTSCWAWLKSTLTVGERTPGKTIPQVINGVIKVVIKDGCKNPNCLAPEPDHPKQPPRRPKGWVGDGDERRCPRCYDYRLRHKGKERPREVVLASPLRARPRIDALQKDGCKNPNCSKKEGDATKFIKSGDDRRCVACYCWKRDHNGEERPLSRTTR